MKKTYKKPKTRAYKLKVSERFLDDMGVGGVTSGIKETPKAHRLTDDSNADELDEFIL